MDVRLRIQTILLIEQMDKHPEHTKELGLEDDSVLSGEGERFTRKEVIHREEQPLGHRRALFRDLR